MNMNREMRRRMMQQMGHDVHARARPVQPSQDHPITISYGYTPDGDGIGLVFSAPVPKIDLTILQAKDMLEMLSKVVVQCEELRRDRVASLLNPQQLLLTDGGQHAPQDGNAEG